MSEKHSVSAFKLERDKLVQPIQNYEQAYLSQVKGVIFIRTKTSEGVSSGSGAIISKYGIILTCNHVISESSNIQVRLSVETNGEIYTKLENVDIVWKSKELDAALLKIADENY